MQSWGYYCLVACYLLVGRVAADLVAKAYGWPAFLMLYAFDLAWVGAGFVAARERWKESVAAGLHARGVQAGLLVLVIAGLGLIWVWTREKQGFDTSSLLLPILIAPLIEELVFRRYLLNEMLRRHSLNVAVIGSAVIFVLGHADLGARWDSRHFCTWFGAGILLGLLYAKVGYWACVLGHALGNVMHQLIKLA